MGGKGRIKNDLQVPSMSSGFMMPLLTNTGSREGHTSLGAIFREIDFPINEFQVFTKKKKETYPVDFDMRMFFEYIVEKKEPCYTIGRNVNFCSHYGN